MLPIVELRMSIGMLRHTTYNMTKLGVTHIEFILSESREEVVTDKLLLSEEGVRVLDRRE